MEQQIHRDRLAGKRLDDMDGKDNENDVNKYIRCEKVPENIIAEAKVDKGE